jgi:hypothetical protein
MDNVKSPGSCVPFAVKAVSLCYLHLLQLLVQSLMNLIVTST